MMQGLKLGFLVGMLAAPLAAQEAAAPDGAPGKCEAVGQMVQAAVDARVEGDPKRRTRKMLVSETDKETGAMLAEYIYALPPEQLTEDVALAFQMQCEQL